MSDALHGADKYSSLIGRNAAAARAQAERSLFWFAIAMSVFILVLLSASITNNSALKIVAFVCLVPVFVCISIRIRLRRRYLRAASAALGIKLSGWHDVPLNPAIYEKWCEKRGISPYSPNDEP